MTSVHAKPKRIWQMPQKHGIPYGFQTSNYKKLRNVTKNWELYLFILPTLIYYLVFRYFPMYGVQLAFKNFKASQGILGSAWIGFDNFIRFFNLPNFWTLIENTLALSLYTLLFGFPIPIILALSLNELRGARYKSLVQTVSYAPHFISTVVLVSMTMIFINPNYGIINKLIELCGGQAQAFIQQSGAFSTIYVLSGIWQNTGWSSVIYFAALSGVDNQLHEAAMIDGASRLKRIWHINIPCIMPTVTIMFIKQVGDLMGVGFEKAFLLQNPLNIEASEIISTYVYKVGIINVQYGFSTTVDLFNSLINFILLLTVNYLVKKAGETSLW